MTGAVILARQRLVEQLDREIESVGGAGEGEFSVAEADGEGPEMRKRVWNLLVAESNEA